ncbi:MAG: hypothetical protein ACYC0X_06710 [Pirellulaceae bacterium]
MSRSRIILAVISACLVVTASSEVWAQRSNRSISRPTLSPYLQQYRYDLGLTDPYTNFMRPTAPQYQNQRMRRESTSSSDRTDYPPRTPETMRARGQNLPQPQGIQIAPTGTGSGFMNYGHFYRTGRTGR